MQGDRFVGLGGRGRGGGGGGGEIIVLFASSPTTVLLQSPLQSQRCCSSEEYVKCEESSIRKKRGWKGRDREYGNSDLASPPPARCNY